MNDLRPHIGWLAILIAAAVIAFGSNPLLRIANTGATQHLAELKTQRVETERNLHQLEDDVATARRLAGQIDPARAEQVLAPADRLQAASLLEHEAAAARLSKFTYTLAPEQAVTVASSGIGQDLTTSNITVSADAPSDTDAYAFLEHIRLLLPGRIRIVQFTLERSSASDAPVTANNLHMNATLEWLSNGTHIKLAGVP